MTLDIAARRSDFQALHKAGYFLLPTAWDADTAKQLEAIGFAGLASSNAGLARTLGRENEQVTRDEVLETLRRLVGATEIAVNADFESGFAADAPELIGNVRLAIDTGIAALSINDTAGGIANDLSNADARIRAARCAINQAGVDVLLVARTESHLNRPSELGDVIKRLIAYASAGADVLCVPGLADPVAIKAIVDAVAPKPLDIELTQPGLTAAALGELGVRRISVGDSFAEMTGAGFEREAQHFIDFDDLPTECARSNSRRAFSRGSRPIK